MNNSLPNSLGLILETLRNQAGGASNSNSIGGLGPFPLGTQRGNFQIGGSAQPISGQATQQNAQMQTVFIGDLPKDVSMVELYEYIKSVAGECDLVLKRPQMKYFYYAFARFTDILDARKLLEEVKFPELHGKTCRALPYDKDLLRSVQAEGNIFVKGFGDKWTHKDLHEAFKAFGDVVSSRVSIEEGHKSRGFGYVQYRKPESAVQAVEEMNGKKYEDLGFELTVTQFKSGHERGSSIAGNSTSTTALFSKKFNNLFVKNFPKSNFTSEELKSYFEPFGEIVSCKVFGAESDDAEAADEDSKVAEKPGASGHRGYGFVCYTRCEDARKALEYFHEKGDESSVSIDVNSGSKGADDSINPAVQATLPKLYVVPALKKELREAYVRMRTLKFKKQMARQNLYFRGFPVDTSVSVEETEKELIEFFSTFGEVSNLKLMLAKKPQTQADSSEGMLGFGFVCYKSIEDAQRARVEASKRPFRGCSLFISQFETKETRKAHMLERIDQIEFARYKKREEVKKDMEKLQKLSDDLRSEQGQLLLTLLKLLAQLSQNRQRQQLQQQQQQMQQQMHQRQAGGAPGGPRNNSNNGQGPMNNNRQYRQRRQPLNNMQGANSSFQQQNQSRVQQQPPQQLSQPVRAPPAMPMPAQVPQELPQQPAAQPMAQPSQDIRQYYTSGLHGIVNTQQFQGGDEPSQRNMIGSFIYPYINLLLKQVQSNNGMPQQQRDLSTLTAKVTGMIIEIPNLSQMLLACQTLDALALKSREAIQLIQQAEFSASSTTSSQPHTE